MRLFPRYHLYVHGRVSLPVDSTVAMRRAMYRMFVFNTPYAVFNMTRGFHLDCYLSETIFRTLSESTTLVCNLTLEDRHCIGMTS